MTTYRQYRFRYVLKETIPKLAWLAHLKKDCEIIHLYHGPWVETKDTFFVEGAWEGEFLPGRFDKAISFYGSGGILNNQAILFATPTHIREKICSIQNDDEIYVSNSMVYLLEKSGFALDENYEYYKEDFYSIEKGIRNYIKHIPINRGNKINIYYHCNIEIKPDFRISEIPKHETEEEFSDFNTYKSFLESSMAAIFKNANDPHRKIRYKPITTLSRGYDSVCCSVLAKRNGCREALTLVNYTNKSDSGAQIAEKLGLNIKEINRLDYLKSKRDFIEAEIFSAGNEISGLYILSLEKHIESRLLITGYHGDIIWGKNRPCAVDSNLENKGSGAAYTEFRLRIGFIHFIIPSLGATKFPSIFQITHSEEMKKWASENTVYDRPIPARIIIEENIGRDCFGIFKMGVGTYTYIRRNILKKILYKLVKTLPHPRIKNHIQLLHLKDSYQPIMKKDSLRDLYHYWKTAQNPSIPSCNFMWGVAKTKNNYH